MNNETTMKPHGVPIGVRRTIAYITLIFFSFLCLIWFYILLINSTRSHSEMTLGFTVLPSTHLLDNWSSLINGTIPIARGFLNSIIVSVCTAVLCTYFSAMTAYAINT